MSLREGVRNVRKWEMTTLWLPCLQSNRAVSALNKARETFNSHLHKGKEMGLDEAEQAKPVRRSEKGTHDIQETETMHATVPKRSVNPKCIPISSRMISFQKVMVKSRQVLNPFLTL